MSAIKQKFSGFWTQIAVDLGLMTREQSVGMLSMQASFLALAEKEIKPTEQYIDKDPLFKTVRDNWPDLKIEHNISDTDFLHHYARAASGKGFEKHEAPASGDIANALGYISKPVKQAILTVQAAVRSEQAYWDVMKPDVEPKSAEDIAKQHGRIDYERKFDPEELVLAQITNKTADELHLRHKSGEQATETELAALRGNIAKAYKAASEMFGALEIPAAAFISQELERAAQAMEKQR